MVEIGGQTGFQLTPTRSLNKGHMSAKKQSSAREEEQQEYAAGEKAIAGKTEGQPRCLFLHSIIC